MTKRFFLILFLIHLAVPTVTAQSIQLNSISTKEQTMNTPLSSLIPDTHIEVMQRKVNVDNETATLTRYERKDGRNTGLGGEHFSMLVAENGRLKGFANIDLDKVNLPLPTREQSEKIARNFLQQYAPDLLINMEIHWIEPHAEPILIQSNGHSETVKLTGMKVKARNLADKLWFWVIVGPDQQAMIFERDITWITFPGHRQTEKWLHDSWLAKQK